MGKRSSVDARLREVKVLEIFEEHGSSTSQEVAEVLGLESPETFFHGRRLRHIIGDLYGLISRTGEKRRGRHCRELPVYALTPDGLSRLEDARPLGHGNKPAVREVRVPGPRPQRVQNVVGRDQLEVETSVRVSQSPRDMKPLYDSVQRAAARDQAKLDLSRGRVFTAVPTPEVRGCERKLVPAATPERVVIPPMPVLGGVNRGELDGCDRIRSVLSTAKARGHSEIESLASVVLEQQKTITRLEAVIAALALALAPYTANEIAG